MQTGKNSLRPGPLGCPVVPDRIDLFFDELPLSGRSGNRHASEERAAQVLKKKSFRVTVDLHQGKGRFSVFTTDFSIDYVQDQRLLPLVKRRMEEEEGAAAAPSPNSPLADY